MQQAEAIQGILVRIHTTVRIHTVAWNSCTIIRNDLYNHMVQYVQSYETGHIVTWNGLYNHTTDRTT
jgi:hypothetical protein